MADVVFVIDSTSNTNYNLWKNNLLAAVNGIINLLDVDTGRVRVGAIRMTEITQVSRLLRWVAPLNATFRNSTGYIVHLAIPT